MLPTFRRPSNGFAWVTGPASVRPYPSTILPLVSFFSEANWLMALVTALLKPATCLPPSEVGMVLTKLTISLSSTLVSHCSTTSTATPFCFEETSIGAR